MVFPQYLISTVAYLSNVNFLIIGSKVKHLLVGRFLGQDWLAQNTLVSCSKVVMST